MDELKDVGLRSAGRYVRRLWPYITLHRWLVLRIAVLVLLISGLGMVPAVVAGHTIDALVRGDVRQLVVLIVAGSAAGMALAALANMQSRTSIELSNRVGATLRERCFEAMQCASIGTVGERSIGDLLNRVQSDVDGVVGALMGMLPVVSAVVTCLWLLVVMPLTDWRLTLVALPFIPLWLLTFIPLAQRVAAVGALMAKARDAFVTVLSESLSMSGLVRVKTFVRYHRDRTALMERYAEFLELNLRQYRAGRSTAIWQALVMAVAPGAVMIAGGMFVAQHQIALATVVTFAGFFGRMLGPVGQLAGAGAHAMTIAFNARRVFELLELPQERRTGTEAIHGGAIELHEVSFGYTEVAVLERFSLRAHAGERLVIEGPSGCGKSTLLRLIIGLLEPERGRIAVGGLDVCDVALDALRRHVGYVPQDGMLFTGTLRANLTYGAEAATDDEVWRALEIVQLDAWVRELELGLETVVSAQAVTLSGGQRQRLVLARTLVARPRVLLLDEATSAVDPHTEAALYEALLAEYPEVTMLIVAHRRSGALREARLLAMRPLMAQPEAAVA